MAVQVQPVLGDVGSDELYLLENAFNALLTALVDPANTTVALLQTAIGADPAIVKVVKTRRLPRPRQFPKRAT